MFYNTILKIIKRIFFVNFKRNKNHKNIDEKAMKLKIGELWIPDNSAQSFAKRIYTAYEEYKMHQSSKLKYIDLAEISEYDMRYREILRERLEKLKLLKRGVNVLCLCARIGTEVKSFIDLGCFAVGIDLNPGENNHYVVHGDFHHVQFADNSVDVVFTNSLDHVFDIKQVLHEINRVLKPEGLFITEAVKGSKEGVSPDFYASFWWERVDDLIHLIEKAQFRVIKRMSYTLPWELEQICFMKDKKA
jgi:SAM-dependent methyltransferase